MSKIEPFIARLTLVIVSIIIVFILVEAAANHWLWQLATVEEFNTFASINQINERYGGDVFTRSHAPHHMLGKIPAPDFRRDDNRHDRLGFRGDEIPADKPEDSYRIVAVGGSTTYSTGVRDYRESYPDLLRDYLHIAGFDSIEVINAGVAGYSSYENLINISFRVLPLEPDLIILLQGYNDIFGRLVYPKAHYLSDNSGVDAPNFSVRIMPAIWEYSTYLRILGIRAGFVHTHGDLEMTDAHRRAQSSYGTEFQRQVESGTYPSGIFEEVSPAQMLADNPPIHFQRNLVSILGIAESHNVDLLLVTMVLSNDYLARTESTRSSFYPNEAFQSAITRHNDITRRMAAATETPFFDLAIEFPDDPALLTDGLHMNAEGNRVRAQLIGDFVIREFLS